MNDRSTPFESGTPYSLLEISDLVVRRGKKIVLEVDRLAIQEGEVLAIIGPNGAGKSTLLLTLSRLLAPERGEIRLRRVPIGHINDLAYRRKIALVMQEPLLLDTSVFENVAAGLRFRKIPKAEIKSRIETWLERLGVFHLRNRPARRLSGGEAQRVSLARAFALQPELLLLDEPFTALDPPTRARLQEDLQSILKETTITTVFITHDLDEALLIGDRVAVILAGKLRQVGSPQEVFNMPLDGDVASFVGVETIIPGIIRSASAGLVIVQANGVDINAVGEAIPGRKVWVCLRPEDITLWQPETGTAPSSARNRIKGRIQRLAPQGPLVRVTLDCGFQVVALVTRPSAEEMQLVEGKTVDATFKATAVHLIPV
jgi:tungstate transport system ATP-binding protein